MVDFIEDHREEHGVEPICRALPIAPSTYHEHRSKRLEPERRSTRAKRDEELEVDIQRVWEESFGGVYGVRKVWQQLPRESKKRRVSVFPEPRRFLDSLAVSVRLLLACGARAQV